VTDFGSGDRQNVTWWSDQFEMMRAAVKIELNTHDKRLSPKITIVIYLLDTSPQRKKL
jgi:hypothetical protein